MVEAADPVLPPPPVDRHQGPDPPRLAQRLQRHLRQKGPGRLRRRVHTAVRPPPLTPGIHPHSRTHFVLPPGNQSLRRYQV